MIRLSPLPLNHTPFLDRSVYKSAPEAMGFRYRVGGDCGEAECVSIRGWSNMARD